VPVDPVTAVESVGSVDGVVDVGDDEVGVGDVGVGEVGEVGFGVGEGVGVGGDVEVVWVVWVAGLAGGV
jgi:hypothetical protein